jgi:2-C-methyl-D-erythritol 4-phosphate cytidylyltransferase
VSGAVAVVLAAGSGDRLGLGTPKGFATLAGRSILAVALEATTECPEVVSVVATVPAGWEERARAEVRASKPVAVIAGGRSRHQSVRLALAAVPHDTPAVLVHDAARCLASPGLFRAVLAALEDADGAIPVVSVPDTVKRIRDGLVVATEPRDELGMAQTPQAFRAAALRDAHRRAEAEAIEFTDDAAALEWAGYSVRAVPGERTNVKITTPEDLAWAEALLASASAVPPPAVPGLGTTSSTQSMRTRG